MSSTPVCDGEHIHWPTSGVDRELKDEHSESVNGQMNDALPLFITAWS